MWHRIKHNKVEHKSDFEFTKDITYLAFAGELWGVFLRIL